MLAIAIASNLSKENSQIRKLSIAFPSAQIIKLRFSETDTDAFLETFNNLSKYIYECHENHLIFVSIPVVKGLYTYFTDFYFLCWKSEIQVTFLEDPFFDLPFVSETTSDTIFVQLQIQRCIANRYKNLLQKRIIRSEMLKKTTSLNGTYLGPRKGMPQQGVAKNQAEQIRKFFHDNPSATNQEAAHHFNVSVPSIIRYKSKK